MEAVEVQPMFGSLRTLLGAAERQAVYRECRVCGTAVDGDTEECPACGSTRIVTYDIA